MTSQGILSLGQVTSQSILGLGSHIKLRDNCEKVNPGEDTPQTHPVSVGRSQFLPAANQRYQILAPWLLHRTAKLGSWLPLEQNAGGDKDERQSPKMEATGLA